MLNSLFRKGFVIWVILLFISCGVFPSYGMQIEKNPITKTKFGNILYVGGNGPGNYTKIQDAIDNASKGDTVFVYDDSSPYIEDIKIQKPLSLIGENRDTTLIIGKKFNNIIRIYSDHVNLSGFTIQNVDYGEKDGLIYIGNWILNINIINFHLNP